MDSTLIIARYNEDIDWVNNLDIFSEKIIYNKGEKLQRSKKYSNYRSTKYWEGITYMASSHCSKL